MKRILMICGLLTAFLMTHAGPVVFTGSTPESGSSITSWNFTLNFDITSALEDCADLGVNVGIGSYYSKPSGMVTTLYRGTPENNDVIGTALTKTLNGKSDTFKVNGNTISFSFDDSMPIVEGQLYTVVITNRFALYKEGTTSMVNATILKCVDDPIVLTFVGGSTDKVQVALKESVPANNSTCDELSEIVLKFTDIVSLTNDSRFDILKDGVQYISFPLSKVEDDGKTILVKFDNPVSFDLSHTYTCRVQEGMIAHGSDKTVKNTEFTFTIFGNKTYIYPVTDKSLSISPNKLPSEFKISYDIPDGKTLLPHSSYTSTTFHMLYIYVSNSDGELLVSKLQGKPLSDGKTLQWNFDNFAWMPDSKYKLVRHDTDDYYIFDGSASSLKECLLESTSYEFNTPSIQEVGFTPMEFTATTISSSDYASSKVYSADMKLSYLSTIQFGLKDKYYVLNGKNYNITVHPDLGDNRVITLYEVTDSGETALYKSTVNIIQKEDSKSYWNEFQTTANVSLYEGKKYKLVIPEGCLTVVQTSYGIVTESDFTKVNYIYNPEIVYTFEGTMPSSFKVNCCSVSDNASIGKLYNIVWEIEGMYNLSEDITKAKYEQVVFADYGQTLKGEIPVSVNRLNTKTYVRIDFTSTTTGEPKKLNGQQSIDITLPAGLLVNALNPDIVSDEIKLHIKGADESALETISVAVNVGGIHEARHITVKGNPYSLTLTPAENWIVESVSHDGKRLVGNNGVYTTEPLISDATIEAHLAYNGPWMVESSSGVYTIEDSNIQVFTEQGMIVVDGVSASDIIHVYNVGGMLIDYVVPQQDRVYITVAPSQIYIVTVNNHAAKIQL